MERSLFRFLYSAMYPLLPVIFAVLSCTSIPGKTPSSQIDSVYEDIHPEPEIKEKIKTWIPPLLTEKVIFYDEFNNTAHGWKTGEDINTRFQLQKGYYVIDNTDDSDAAFSTIPVELDYTSNFIIETMMIKMAGEDECSYGIAWGFNPETGNTHYVIVYKNYVLYGKRQNGKWKTLINWRQSSYISEYSRENKIAVKKTNSFAEIFINEQLIITIDSLENFQGNSGFILFGNIMVKADFFLITEYSMPDNRVPADDARTEFLVTPGHEYLFEEPGKPAGKPAAE